MERNLVGVVLEAKECTILRSDPLDCASKVGAGCRTGDSGSEEREILWETMEKLRRSVNVYAPRSCPHLDAR